MQDYSQKSLIKLGFFSFGVVLIVVIVGCLALNIFLNKFKGSIEQQLSAYVEEGISINRVFYLPPNFVIFKEISFYSYGLPKEGQQCFFKKIKQVKIEFSKKSLFKKKKLAIKNVTFKEPVIYCAKSDFDFKNSILLISSFWGYLPRNISFGVAIEKGVIFLPGNSDSGTLVGIENRFKIDRENLSGVGSISIEPFYSKSSDIEYIDIFSRELKYSFNGYIGCNGLNVESLEFRWPDSYLKLRGSFEKEVLRLNGFSYLGNFFESFPNKDLFGKIKFFLSKSQPYFHMAGDSKSGLSISKIDCIIKLKLPILQIEKANFYINDIPAVISGNVLFMDPISIGLMFSTFQKQQSINRMQNTRAMDMKIEGVLNEGAFSGDIDLNFIKEKNDVVYPQSVKAEFKELGLEILPARELRVKFKDANLIYRAVQEYKAYFSKFNFLLSRKENRKNIFKFNTAIFDGYLDGAGEINTSKLPYINSFDFKIRDVSSNEIGCLFFPKIYGKLSARGRYSNYPLELAGEIFIKDGCIKDLDFFNWLGDFFMTPSLKETNFEIASALISVNDESRRFERLNLESKDISIEGFFTLYKNDLVSSKVSLSLSRELLSNSPNFKNLSRILGSDFSSLAFDFQLSGLLGAMNFKWLESDFKNKLKRSIPGFIERGLEKNVEEAIKSISKRQ